MRVVSLACSNTEIVCALGSAELLCGVDDHSDFPTEVVKRLPRVGPDLEIDVERVSALEPDLVLASLTVPGHEKVVARLDAAGLPFVALEPIRLDDVYRDILRIGELLGVDRRAADLVAQMRNGIAPRRPSAGPSPRILVQWWPKPVIAPGNLSWVNDLIELAGGSNPLGDEAVKSRPVAVEEVTELAPDAMVLSWCGVAPHKVRSDVVYRQPEWQSLPFVRNERVFKIPEAVTGRPAPRLVEGFRQLCRVVDATRGA